MRHVGDIFDNGEKFLDPPGGTLGVGECTDGIWVFNKAQINWLNADIHNVKLNIKNTAYEKAIGIKISIRFLRYEVVFGDTSDPLLEQLITGIEITTWWEGPIVENPSLPGAYHSTTYTPTTPIKTTKEQWSRLVAKCPSSPSIMTL